MLIDFKVILETKPAEKIVMKSSQALQFLYFRCIWYNCSLCLDKTYQLEHKYLGGRAIFNDWTPC